MAGRGRGRGGGGQLGPTARDDDGNVLEAASPPKLFPVCCQALSHTNKCVGVAASAREAMQVPSVWALAGLDCCMIGPQDVMLPDRPGDDRRIAELRAQQKKLNDFWRGSVYRVSTGNNAGAQLPMPILMQLAPRNRDPAVVAKHLRPVSP